MLLDYLLPILQDSIITDKVLAANELRTIRTLANSDLGQLGPDSYLSRGEYGPWSIQTLVNSDLDHRSIRTP